MAKSIFNSDKGLQAPKLMHPVREWTIGLLAGILILIGTGVWSAQTYIFYRNTGNISYASVETEVVVYRASLVEVALTNYANKVEVNRALLANTPSVISTPEEVEDEVFFSSTTNQVGEDSLDSDIDPIEVIAPATSDVFEEEVVSEERPVDQSAEDPILIDNSAPSPQQIF